MKLAKKTSKRKFTKADAFSLLEATGIEQNTSPIVLMYREKVILKDLIIKELKEIEQDSSFDEDDIKLKKLSLYQTHLHNREKVLEDIYLKLHE